MKTLKTTPRLYYRECTVCKGREILPRYGGSTKNLLLRNSFRVRYSGDRQLKDMLQPFNGGKVNKQFAEAYPDLAEDYYSQGELNEMGMDKIVSQKGKGIKET